MTNRLEGPSSPSVCGTGQVLGVSCTRWYIIATQMGRAENPTFPKKRRSNCVSPMANITMHPVTMRVRRAITHSFGVLRENTNRRHARPDLSEPDRTKPAVALLLALTRLLIIRRHSSRYAAWASMASCINKITAGSRGIQNPSLIHSSPREIRLRTQIRESATPQNASPPKTANRKISSANATPANPQAAIAK